jgi:hypothetical protein
MMILEGWPTLTTYIDFECLASARAAAGRNKAAAAHPVLLGVLSEDNAARTELHQVILDPGLASARVAAGRLTVGCWGSRGARRSSAGAPSTWK